MFKKQTQGDGSGQRTERDVPSFLVIKDKIAVGRT